MVGSDSPQGFGQEPRLADAGRSHDPQNGLRDRSLQAAGAEPLDPGRGLTQDLAIAPRRLVELESSGSNQGHGDAGGRAHFVASVAGDRILEVLEGAARQVGTGGELGGAACQVPAHGVVFELGHAVAVQAQHAGCDQATQVGVRMLGPQVTAPGEGRVEDRRVARNRSDREQRFADPVESRSRLEEGQRFAGRVAGPGAGPQLEDRARQPGLEGAGVSLFAHFGWLVLRR